ncbi:MAG: SagB/ThcOx family dehydrogenase [Candidatus Hydrogenedentes bacterium]|nr:SagB/ThcOx family dehydrogenase [Candidatus Hydrogenedentota bacterium]
MEVARGYHEATKHHPYRYARSLGYLDWATQPDPFRRYPGAPLFLLPFPRRDESPPYDDLYAPGRIRPTPVNLHTIAQFFECSLAISAWKEYQGERWALRCNPSSGNLHPTEGYLIAGPIEGLSDAPAVYHYRSDEHALERRTQFPLAVWQELTAEFPSGAFLAGLTSIHWREAWKYGERAYRYCQHDAGHALAAYALSAAALGWQSRHLEGLSDEDVSTLLGLDRGADFEDAECEHPDLIIAVYPGGNNDIPLRLPRSAIEEIKKGRWQGHANRLSTDHQDWEIINAAAEACAKPSGEFQPHDSTCSPVETPAATGSNGPGSASLTRRLVSARRIFLQRRSAVAMDGRTRISREAFYRTLSRAMPFPGTIPWDAFGEPVAVHLAIFVHRVDGIPPGLYCLPRSSEAFPSLKECMRPDFRWERPAGGPSELPLYLLRAGNFQNVAGQVSCGQEIASDGAFSLGMLAEFESRLEKHGAWFYRRLFWETGVIGQVLYLEAEAAGIRSTGIGCFFDEAMHELLGLRNRQFQSLYHFTVGGHVDDPRLTTLPPYTDARRRLEGPVPDP